MSNVTNPTDAEVEAARVLLAGFTAALGVLAAPPRAAGAQNKRGLVAVDVAALVLGISPTTLQSKTWRTAHGVPCVPIGRLVRYNPTKLLEWAERRRDRSGR